MSEKWPFYESQSIYCKNQFAELTLPCVGASSQPCCQLTTTAQHTATRMSLLQHILMLAHCSKTEKMVHIKAVQNDLSRLYAWAKWHWSTLKWCGCIHRSDCYKKYIWLKTNKQTNKLLSTSSRDKLLLTFYFLTVFIWHLSSAVRVTADFINSVSVYLKCFALWFISFPLSHFSSHTSCVEVLNEAISHVNRI